MKKNVADITDATLKSFQSTYKSLIDNGVCKQRILNCDERFHVMNTVSATGHVLAPFVIISLKYKNEVMNGCALTSVPDTLNTVQPVWWDYDNKYYVIFTSGGGTTKPAMEVYVRHVVNMYRDWLNQDIYLLWDAANTNKSFEVKIQCLINGIYIIEVPANTTGILQVNDLVCFAQLKEHMRTIQKQDLVIDKVSSTSAVIRYVCGWLLNSMSKNNTAWCFDWVAVAPIVDLRQPNIVFDKYTEWKANRLTYMMH